jgi:hypothetical protein
MIHPICPVLTISQQLTRKTPRLSDDMKLLIHQLMVKVTSNVVKPFCGGSYDEPRTYRYDGRMIDAIDQPDLHVTWVSIPYATLFNSESFLRDQSSSLPPYSSSHPPRTLLQTLYDNEPILKRDSTQVFTSGIKDPKQALHIAHVWFLIIGEGKKDKYTDAWRRSLTD